MMDGLDKHTHTHTHTHYHLNATCSAFGS